LLLASHCTTTQLPLRPIVNGLPHTFTVAISGTLNVPGNGIQALPEFIFKHLMTSLLQHSKL
jgi:hypothetical protein